MRRLSLAPGLSQAERERYRRQLRLAGFGEAAQLRLRSASVLVSGCGGVGGAAALYLAAAGVGHLVLSRGGPLALEDLNRQVLATEDRVGWPAVWEVRDAVRRVNRHVQVDAVEEPIRRDGARRQVRRVDLALDAAAAFAERDALNRACVALRRPMVEVAVDDFAGHLTTFLPGETPCLHCLYRLRAEPDPDGPGVLGAAAGAMGCLAALEALKVLGRFGTPLAGRMLSVDLAAPRFSTYTVRRDPRCAVCAPPFPGGGGRAEGAARRTGSW
ncbi:HesA/MoeB/ThiF family protein [Anaeromyxobacter paludicola]|uniref:Molybdopterin-synthase adenylyltransferase MoeB n=1 Tax=Anaeromyxobacter paludicola TaxID=2918171 RepID=A0ABN6NC75_9BACT|nr:ThiF family adenylyltransferase [Anaeromyxobacter paludicola]BDG10849.1 molybdopterin-synthase adenylyltransferase MoeB [Anaeromyxobacter paludicola]